MRKIPCEFEMSTYNTLCSRGPPKVLAESRKNARGGHLVFQNKAKNIPRQDVMVMNISCKFDKASYNIYFVKAVTVKSLYTLRRRRRHNEAKSIVSTGCYPVDTKNVLKVVLNPCTYIYVGVGIQIFLFHLTTYLSIPILVS